MNIIQAIALLCQLHSGVNTEVSIVWLATQQMRCQQYFAKCYEAKKPLIAWDLKRADDSVLIQCIKDQSR